MTTTAQKDTIVSDALQMAKRAKEIVDLRLPIASTFAYSKIGAWKNTNPFVVAFVYPQKSKACIVKGGMKQVTPYIVSHYKACFVHYTLWHKGKCRQIYSFYGLRKGIKVHLMSPKWALVRARSLYQHDQHYDKPIRWDLEVTTDAGVYKGNSLFQKYMKKPPRSWIRELDPFVAA